jgi:hypothetical protein
MHQQAAEKASSRVILSPFAPIRTVLSEAKELRVNSAKDLFCVFNEKEQMLRGDYSEVLK